MTSNIQWECFISEFVYDIAPTYAYYLPTYLPIQDFSIFPTCPIILCSISCVHLLQKSFDSHNGVVGRDSKRLGNNLTLVGIANLANMLSRMPHILKKYLKQTIVARWLLYLFNTRAFTTSAQYHIKIAKKGSKFCQIYRHTIKIDKDL